MGYCHKIMAITQFTVFTYMHKPLFQLQCRSKISEHRIGVPYTSDTRMRMLSYAYAYVVIRVHVCPAFVIHCHTFALCGIVLHNKRNGKVKVTARSTKFAYENKVSYFETCSLRKFNDKKPYYRHALFCQTDSLRKEK